MSEQKFAYALYSEQGGNFNQVVASKIYGEPQKTSVGFTVFFQEGYFSEPPAVSLTPYNIDNNNWVASVTIGAVSTESVSFSMADMTGAGTLTGFSLIAIGS